MDRVKCRWSDLLCLVDVELHNAKEEVAIASVVHGDSQVVALQETLELVFVGDFTEIDGAQVLQWGFHVLHDFI